MLDLGPFSEFIIAAYSISFITLVSLIIWVHRSESHHKKRLDLLKQTIDNQ